MSKQNLQFLQKLQKPKQHEKYLIIKKEWKVCYWSSSCVIFFWTPCIYLSIRRPINYKERKTNVFKDSTIKSTDKEEIKLIISQGLINPSKLSSKQYSLSLSLSLSLPLPPLHYEMYNLPQTPIFWFLYSFIFETWRSKPLIFQMLIIVLQVYYIRLQK